jgi:hypothetical protein
MVTAFSITKGNKEQKRTEPHPLLNSKRSSLEKASHLEREKELGPGLRLDTP